MGEQAKKPHISTGLLAHVDAGKTTLSEALLYVSGARRTLGRVDHRDAFLDTHALERARGITIFSKQARLTTENLDVTLVDTPGHADFSAEAERTMPVLDCAVLVISGTDGVQAHTLTLWRLLEKYQVPVVLFINKMDLPGINREKLLSSLRQNLSTGCVDFGGSEEEIAEAAALCDEALLENYLETGTVTPGNIRGLVAKRKLFPCCFGSALKLEGVKELLDVLDTYAPRQQWGADFGARVYKISRDPQGNRLTWLKITGGSLPVRSVISYQNTKDEQLEEKAVQLRLYSGEKFTAVDTATAGMLVAVTGLSGTWAGQGLGREAGAPAPVLEPVMTYRVALPSGTDPMTFLPKMRQLEEEDPQLHVVWNDRLKQIFVQIMGKVQLEILRSLIQQRFSLDVNLDQGRIYYKETIADTVEGVGHYEPLRHYAEVHLLLEPLPQGSGLVVSTRCSADVLEAHYQNLVLTHLLEKTHVGVLTGSPITDMKITLLIGRAHIKHTEGGDFRQATYRAVRQGLMQAKSVLLEPWYDFRLTLPTEQIGRAITDIRAMGGEFDAPEAVGNTSTLQGQVPASELGDYADQLAAYTQGRGQLQLSLHGYAPCHNAEKVVEEMGYDPLADIANTPDSVFCDHGAGFHVPWNRVKDYMHLESGLKPKPAVITRNLQPDDKALEEIMRRQFGDLTTTLYKAPENRPAEEKLTIRPPRQQYLIVDGYNIIFAWDSLAETAKHDLDAARRSLCDALSNYAGFKKCRLVLVFDGYKVKGSPGKKEQFHNIQVVYTAEGETADAYIEALVSQVGTNYNLRVATSDSLVQLSSLRSGVLRMSARELQQEVENAKKEMVKHYQA
ncbi:MAG: TetM/TetW/TetO/TetS family tetracycline resistance ribosomal protection protein [Oscillospiraceae bacterium]|nr:TetM/TetW/TetO/TetS family tetracycline resistance ribosomal protection protein [Oscillospiraceae bacterium]